MSNTRKKPTLPKHELRVIRNVGKLEIRSQSGVRTISGYFSKFDSLSEDLGGFVEKIQPGAFRQSLIDNPDVLCLYNHNSDLILGRVSSGTLSVSEDNIGLRFKVTLPVGVSYADDLIVLMERGDVTSCSFSFSVGPNGDKWDMVGDQLVRTLLSVTVYEGSIVGQPAYPSTVADLRSCPVALRSKLKRSALDENPCDPTSSNYDETDPNCTGDDDLDDDDSDSDWDDRSIDYKCQYRCQRCSDRSLSHLSNLTEDDADARSKRFSKTDPRLSNAEFAKVEAQRCSWRCSDCRAIGHGYSIQEDDADARAHAHLLSLRSR